MNGAGIVISNQKKLNHKKKNVETTDSPNTGTQEGGYQQKTIVF